MSNTNLIYQILEENGLPELYQESGDTVLEMEDFIGCPKNPSNPKEQLIPLMSLVTWVDHLRSLDDVEEVLAENSGFGGARGNGKELRVTLKVRLKGSMKKPLQDHEFAKVFGPIQDTLLRLLARRLSYQTYIGHQNTDSSQSDDEESLIMRDAVDMDDATLLARSAIV
ncbi:MAG: hypothetical protein HQM12_03595 [SAR324 cluster bacterium]|nr:hypothetical protein [SAR324 cluster bacterium]MBF0350706.1 hypothetical protein [SAR324 cluster bacterium]